LQPDGHGERIAAFSQAFAPERRVSNASPDAPVSFEQRTWDMRDFRHAKAMARTLRASLAARGFKITLSQSLELIAEAFGMADWNTLSAKIRAEAAGPRDNVAPSQLPAAWSGYAFSAALNSTLLRAIAYSSRRNHEFTTLEHLLLGLIDDVDASAVMTACKVDLGTLKERLVTYIDNDLKTLVIDDGETRPTAAFARVIQRAAIHVLSSGRQEVTGANILVAIFAENESPAVHFLQEQEMTRFDAVNYITHGIKKGDTAA
jgi:Glyoxalase superfamily protein/Clp amino terminal domain, pathogenicity island component